MLTSILVKDLIFNIFIIFTLFQTVLNFSYCILRILPFCRIDFYILVISSFTHFFPDSESSDDNFKNLHAYL